MNEFLRYQKQMFLIVLISAIVLAALALAVWPGRIDCALGLLIGAACGLIRFRMTVNGIIHFAQDPENNQPRNAIKSSFTAFIITAIGLYLVAGTKLIVTDRVGEKFLYLDAPVWCAFIGLLLPQLTLWIDGFLRPNHLAPLQGESSEA